MRRPYPFIGLSLALLSCLAASACRAPGQLVLGFVTDLSAPDSLDRVEMRVYDDANATLVTGAWDLPGVVARDFSLPGSFALTEGDGVPLVHIDLVGLKKDPLSLEERPVVTRTAGVAFVDASTLFFRMALVERCQGMSCGAGQSCIEGKCRPALTNAVSILPYRSGMEREVACNSGSSFLDTASKQAMPVAGTGTCAADQWCGEATCYRNQGQGLVWCTPPGDVCTGVDGYEGCVIAQCAAPLQSCYGATWREGRFGGPCRSYAECRSACGCDPECMSACDAARPAECSACLVGSGGAQSCLETAGASCNLPTCGAST